MFKRNSVSCAFIKSNKSYEYSSLSQSCDNKSHKSQKLESSITSGYNRYSNLLKHKKEDIIKSLQLKKNNFSRNVKAFNLNKKRLSYNKCNIFNKSSNISYNLLKKNNNNNIKIKILPGNDNSKITPIKNKVYDDIENDEINFTKEIDSTNSNKNNEYKSSIIVNSPLEQSDNNKMNNKIDDIFNNHNMYNNTIKEDSNEEFESIYKEESITNNDISISHNIIRKIKFENDNNANNLNSNDYYYTSEKKDVNILLSQSEDILNSQLDNEIASNNINLLSYFKNLVKNYVPFMI